MDPFFKLDNIARAHSLFDLLNHDGTNNASIVCCWDRGRRLRPLKCIQIFLEGSYQLFHRPIYVFIPNALLAGSFYTNSNRQREAIRTQKNRRRWLEFDMEAVGNEVMDEKRRERNVRIIIWWLSVVVCVRKCATTACLLLLRQRHLINRSTYTIDFYSHWKRFREMVYANDVICFDQIRMCRAKFDRLCGMLTTIGALTPTKNMLVDEQVAMFLNILAHHVKNRVIQFEFRRSGESISRTFNRVLTCIMRLGRVLLKTLEPIPQDSTNGRWKWFKNCLGAVDGTHIKIRVPIGDKPHYSNRKGEISTNVLGVCSHDGQFIYVLTGWRDQQQTGEYCMMLLLGLMALRCHMVRLLSEGFLAPYRGQRYHLNEWRDGRQSVTPQECFNMRHSSALNAIERYFGMLKMRWAILRSPLFYPVRTHNRIVTACCLLHYLIRRYSASDPMDDAVIEGDGEGDYAVNSILMETHTISSIETFAAWSNWRDSLASEMFDEFRSHR
ncbi:protein ALP1-like [Senna tora]|uniref:Protein ALP1-like n=1 Tax=Senna tora TaxID=362788 RepID=A0A834SQU5_9FABA|nr:protein ALP1-like [Senna tora]